MVITKKDSRVINFTAINEDRKSFIDKFVEGTSVKVKGKNENIYELHINHLKKEDGGGFRFLFESTLIKATTPTGLTDNVRHKFKGYIDTKTGNGWIQHIDEFAWK